MLLLLAPNCSVQYSRLLNATVHHSAILFDLNKGLVPRPLFSSLSIAEYCTLLFSSSLYSAITVRSVLRTEFCTSFIVDAAIAQLIHSHRSVLQVSFANAHSTLSTWALFVHSYRSVSQKLTPIVHSTRTWITFCSKKMIHCLVSFTQMSYFE